VFLSFVYHLEEVPAKCTPFTLAARLELSMQNRNAEDLDELVQVKTK
jgi:hypothetical protein